METDDILCEAPGPDGMTCTKPYGHEGNQHHFEVQLPPHVARIVATQMERLDDLRQQLDRQIRWMKLARYSMYGALVLNLLACAVNMVGAITRT